MNKSLIVLLAVCLVSVHAFVRRDAPANAKQDIVGSIQQNLESLKIKTTEGFNKIFDVDAAKENLDKLLKDGAKLFNDLISTTAKPPAK